MELKKLDADLKNQRSELGKGKAVREHAGAAAADEEEVEDPRSRRRGDDDDEASEIGDGDAVTSKMKRQRKEQGTYEDEDDDDEDAGELDDMDIEAAYASAPEDDADEEAAELAAPALDAEVGRVEALFMENLPSATSFSFRDSGCKIGLQVRWSHHRPCEQAIDDA